MCFVADSIGLGDAGVALIGCTAVFTEVLPIFDCQLTAVVCCGGHGRFNVFLDLWFPRVLFMLAPQSPVPSVLAIHHHRLRTPGQAGP